MDTRTIIIIMVLFSFFGAGCTGKQESDSGEPVIKEEPENAMDEDTKKEFDQLMEEFQRTGKMPEKLAEGPTVPPEGLNSSA